MSPRKPTIEARHLEHATHQLGPTVVAGRDGGRLFTIQAPQLRTVHQFNARMFIRLVLQHTGIERDPTLYIDTVDAKTETLLSQLLFSYKINPQTAAYAGYTDNRLGTDAYDLARTDRTYFVKLGYAWLR